MFGYKNLQSPAPAPIPRKQDRPSHPVRLNAPKEKCCKSIPEETFQQLARTYGKALTKLVLLDSDACLGAPEMIEFARHCPDLRHLNVSWLESVPPKINDEVVLELTSNCLRLEYISLLDANEVSDVSFQTLSKLRYLRNFILCNSTSKLARASVDRRVITESRL
ncbi:hypothetical protein BC939DRAFT_506767 [Gamsiella multidivaricata]|uniref:uncharacterized protein n=1 Tax=Gamsiella multidivaricata TaxID=101098 RepID=UPI0022201DEA|nr:uncharacterized protein BC939DRAFT_506767 [Gamsiella multidivaricata]KAI7818134.1 hypothetical protein BC939DRAFT_506767 [Gamsiella multidivaricata]